MVKFTTKPVVKYLLIFAALIFLAANGFHAIIGMVVFISAGILLLWLIFPDTFSKAFKRDIPRGKLGKALGALVVVFFLTLAISQKPNIAPVEPFTFDIPSLLGKNIDEVRQALGKPADATLDPTKEQMRLLGPTMLWSNEFKKNGKLLNVEYTVGTRKVQSFFVTSDNASFKASERDYLMNIGNVKDGDVRYNLRFVKALRDPSTYTGLEITPKL